MAVKVSVVVPVYNPGPHIDRLIASLLRQSLPPDEFEAVFVDDGSTDGTGERLDALSAEHANFTVVHIPNSGWPGRPRNVGIDTARGTYVYFVDNDDWLGDEALERLYAMAERNASDVVIGKMAGHGRRVPRELFAATRDRVSVESFPPLTAAEFGIDPLTPHKLFRKAFLDEHAIRFPEGRRRLEDHVFVMQAYFRADVISVLADYVCYHWARRRDKRNAANIRLDPRGYFENGREVLDIVERHTAPGPLRDRLFAAWYEGKMLWRVGAGKLLAYEPDYRRELFAEIRHLALERFGPDVVARLPAHLRVRSALLRAGDLEGLLALARVESGLEPTALLEEARREAGRLVLRMSGRLAYEGGAPLAFRRDGEKLYWDPPVELGPAVRPADREVTGELEASRIDVFVRSRKERAEFFLPADSVVVRHDDDDGLHISLEAEARLDPVTAGAGSPLARDLWDVLACVRTAGWARVVPVASAESASATMRPVVGGDAVRITPRSTARGTLAVAIGPVRSRSARPRFASTLLRR